jgi:hypothetical protein
MDKATATVRQSRAEGRSGWLAGYRPASLEPSEWAAVQPFVVECAARLGLNPSAGASRVVRVLARLAAWSLDEGLPLEAEVVLDPDTIERFVTSRKSIGRSQATDRGVLRRVGPLLTTKAPWEPRPAPLARRQVALPYSDAELVRLHDDARSQSTQSRRRAARALLALGAGAGLDGRWIARVRANDVACSASGLLVTVGEPSARVVPVLGAHEGELAELVTSAGDEFLIGGYSVARNRAGALAASLAVGHGHSRFSASRLRSTWLVSHLRMGTRLPELARAAGLGGVTVLSDLLEFVPAIGEAEANEMLRGPR